MKKIIFILILLICSYSVFAWGQLGHRVVGKIAENHLTPQAKKAMQEILGTESLAVASTWMDEVKSDDTYDHTHVWHYTTVPDGKTYADAEKNEKGDVVMAIENMKVILQSSLSSENEKKEALKFLIHLIGDIHQPLHVGNGEDRGGNDYKIKWFYESSNLHRIWDSEMIDFKQFSYTELAENIDHIDVETIKILQATNAEDWANEAATIRPSLYPDPGLEKLSYEYAYQHWNLMQEQLLKGGIRLAGVLNEIFK